MKNELIINIQPPNHYFKLFVSFQLLIIVKSFIEATVG